MMNSNAIAHFETLQREKQSFERATQTADQERVRVENRLVQLRASKKRLEDDSRELSDAVGILHRQETMHKAEISRLQSVIQEERKALEECVRETDELLEMERKRKQSFCQEMFALNDELGEMLIQRDEMRLVQLISVESIPLLREILRENARKQTLDDDKENKEQRMVNQGTDLMHDEVEETKLREASSEYHRWQQHKEEVQAKIRKFREIAVQSSNDRKVCTHRSIMKLPIQQKILTTLFLCL